MTKPSFSALDVSYVSPDYIALGAVFPTVLKAMAFAPPAGLGTYNGMDAGADSAAPIPNGARGIG